MWDYITPVRCSLYTYTGFLRAVEKFPAFCGDYTDGRDSDKIARRLLATCLAHFAQETGAGDDYMAKTEGIPRWRQSLYYVREMGYEKGFNEGKNDYNSECSVYSWQPNAIDSAQGIKPGFGATINVINGGVECGYGETEQAANRTKYYKEFAPFMGVEISSDEELGCADQGIFIVGGAGVLLIQWGDDAI